MRRVGLPIPERRILARYGAGVVLIFALALVVPGLSGAYCHVYALMCNITFGVLGVHGTLSMEVLAEPTDVADVAVRLLSPNGQEQRFLGSARSHGFIDTAFVTALLAASTLPLLQRLRAILLGVTALQLFVVGKFGLATWLFVSGQDDSVWTTGGARIHEALFEDNMESGLVFSMVTAALIVSWSQRAVRAPTRDAAPPLETPEVLLEKPEAPKTKKKKKKRRGKRN